MPRKSRRIEPSTVRQVFKRTRGAGLVQYAGSGVATQYPQPFVVGKSAAAFEPHHTWLGECLVRLSAVQPYEKHQRSRHRRGGRVVVVLRVERVEKSR
jgi:hypothetical protein